MRINGWILTTQDSMSKLYVEEYAKLDPMTAGQSMSTVDNPFASTDIIDVDELYASRHYQEWIRPQEFVDFINVAMEKSPHRVLLFGVFRHERDGMVDDGTRWRMRLLAPHLKRASLVERPLP